MFNIASYLERFKNFGQGERLLKEAIISSVKEVLGLDLPVKCLCVKNGEVTFKVDPAIKNALFIKKEAILARIKEKNTAIINNIR
jgi:hypothetical protein